MRFELTVLGTSAAVPAYGRLCSGQLLRTEREDFLIDCGEGIQIQLQLVGVGHGRISLILISHLHGDHYFGLPGLLTSWMLNGRQEPLTIISPPGLRERISPLLELGKYPPPFEIEFREIAAVEKQPIWESKSIEIMAFPLRHRLPTNGYLIRETLAQPNIRKSAITAYQIPHQQIREIKAGGDFITETGQKIPHLELVTPPPIPRSYAYCSDTRYFPGLAEWVRGVDLLYHEATFLHEDLEHAERTMHSTAREAAELAKLAEASTLVIGHFSARYPRVQLLEDEARRVFTSTYAAKELMRVVVPKRSAVKEVGTD